MSSWNTSNSSYGAYYKSQSKVPTTNLLYPAASYQSPQTYPYTYQTTPQGLQNLGNTCYISAVLQILFQIISENILTLTSKSQQEVTYLFLRLRQTKDTNDYQKFKEALQDRVEMVKGWEQQDSHELMVHLIEELRKENPLPLKSGKIDLEYDQKRGFQQNWEKFTSQMLKLQNGKIISLFYGQILKEFSCPVKHTKHKFERFMGVSLHFPASSTHTSSYLVQSPIKLQDMIQSFLGRETINDLNCEQCKAKRSFIKESVFYSIPSFLIIHLSRFDKGWYSNHKNSRQVQFDQALELFSKNQKKATLRLLGVIHHLGTINRGHYFAQIRVGQQWFEMNDDKVSKTQMRLNANVSATAYILVYQKK